MYVCDVWVCVRVGVCACIYVWCASVVCVLVLCGVRVLCVHVVCVCGVSVCCVHMVCVCRALVRSKHYLFVHILV